MNRKSLSALCLAVGLGAAATLAGTAVSASATAPSPKAPMAKPASAAQARAAAQSGKVPQITSLAPVKGIVQVTSGVLVDTAGSQTAGGVACPSGTQVVGGGAVIYGSSLNENLNGSLPFADGSAWRVYVNNASATDGTFQVYAQCSKTIPKYAVVYGTGVDNPSSQIAATVSCPKGTFPLGGGGVASSSATSANLNSSFPLAKGWRIDVNNASGGSNLATAAAVCGKKPTGYVQVEGSSVTNGAGRQTGATAGCPSGTTVLGGGAYSGSGSTSVNLNSSTPSGSAGWVAYENNASASDTTVKAYAVCATSK